MSIQSVCMLGAVVHVSRWQIQNYDFYAGNRLLCHATAEQACTMLAWLAYV